MNGREAQESGLLLKAWIAPRPVVGTAPEVSHVAMTPHSEQYGTDKLTSKNCHTNCGDELEFDTFCGGFRVMLEVSSLGGSAVRTMLAVVMRRS
jgi:hypothetical protein